MEPLVYSQAVEALLIRGLAGRIDADARAELRALGIDLDRPLLPAYPLATWNAATEVAARRVFPELPRAEAYWRLGASTVLGMYETMVGRASLSLARLVGPRRTLLRMDKTNKSTTNYVTTRVFEKSPTCIEVEMAPFQTSPEFLAGSLQTLVEVCGGASPRCEQVSFEPGTQALRLRVSWTG